jgi:hypothetical protein
MVTRGALTVGLMIMLSASCARLSPGDSFPSFVILNRCKVAVTWTMTDTGGDFNTGTLAPGAEYRYGVGSDTAVLTVRFELPSGAVVEKSGDSPLVIEPDECA